VFKMADMIMIVVQRGCVEWNRLFGSSNFCGVDGV
jgi:hypothetical protein